MSFIIINFATFKHDFELETLPVLDNPLFRVKKCFGDIKEKLGRLEQKVGEKPSGDMTLRFLDVNLCVELESLDCMLREVLALKRGMGNEVIVPVEVLLDLHQVRLRYVSLLNGMVKMLEEQIRLCGSVKERNDGCVYGKESVSDIDVGGYVDCVKGVMVNVLDVMLKTRRIIGEYACEIEKEFLKTGLWEVSELWDKVDEYVVEYARGKRKSEERRLQLQAQNKKRNSSEKLSREHWCGVLDTEKEARKMASRGKLVAAAEECYEDYDEGMRSAMEGNRLLMKEMIRFSMDDEMFDMEQLRTAECRITDMLTTENIDFFSRMVLRWNIIQSKMNEDVKRKFEGMMAGNENEKRKEKEGNVCENREGEEGMSCENMEELKRIKDYLRKGKWQGKANDRNVSDWIETLYGAKPKRIEKTEYEAMHKFRDFFRVGRGGNSERLQIAVANIVGYMIDCCYLPSAPKVLSREFFGNESLDNNINKGKKGNRSKAFDELIPFMEKYRERVIEGGK